MGALSRHVDSPLIAAEWQPDVGQLLEEQHLVAHSEFAGRRLQFAAALARFFAAQRDTEVCTFYGRYITDLESFCYQLERAMPGPTLSRRVDGPGSVTSLLRHRVAFPGRRAARFRYYIWHDADQMLRADRSLFGRLVDALTGVAAEAEYTDDDMLLLHRTVLVGSSAVREYASDPAGQCRSWWRDGLGEPFWQVVTGLEAPSFQLLSIDVLDR